MKISLGNIATPMPISGITLPTPKILYDVFGYSNVKVVSSDDVKETSIFGTPVFMSLTVDAFQWTESTTTNGVTTSTTHKVPSFHIPCVICEVTFQKLIIKTFVQRQKMAGSFKEHINMGDYAIVIKGVLCNDDDKYPLDLVNYLNQIIQAPVSIEITHTILNKLGIYNLVIESGQPIQDANGRQNMQPFTLNCISDDSRSLTINVSQ